MTRFILGLSLWLAAEAAWEEGSAPATAPAAEQSHSVGSWLELQRSGTVAAPPAPLPADEAARAYRNFLKTYDLAIPPFYYENGGETGK